MSNVRSWPRRLSISSVWSGVLLATAVAGGCSSDDSESGSTPIDRCATVRCAAGTHCVDGACVPDKPPDFCGGIAGFPCPDPLICVDDPRDDCDPNAGGADCGGICVPKGERCGTNTCGQDQFCCNASCGICAPKGGACIQIAC